MLDGLTNALASRGIELATFGGAYLLFLGNLVLAVAFYAAARSWLVISPNRPARHYGIYVVMVLAGLIIATVLENEIVPRHAATLQYAALPHLLVLLMLHLWIYSSQQPWLIALGAAANAGAVVTVVAAAIVGDPIRAQHWLTAGLILGLLTYLAYYSISTKRGFMNATSIYLSTKERAEQRAAPQVPWLGIPQWLGLTLASVALATLNSLLRAGGPADIAAATVAGESTLLLTVTTAVCAIPATAYWLAHRHWMPELTRFAWLVWVVVGFAFTYGNFLTSLDRA